MNELANRLSTMSSQRLTLLALDLHQRLEQAQAAAAEPIAVVGMACRFPGAPDVASFWRLLIEGREAVDDMPGERWDVDALYAPNPETLGHSYTRRGSFIENPARFDAAFFGMSPREARATDPQQRLLLETAWHALEDALIVPASLEGSRTGVFVGVSTTDYLQYSTKNSGLDEIDAYTGIGCSPSVAAGRLSYVLGLNGPSLPIDTACSSSLVAVHLACQSLRNREADLVLAGGVNLMLSADTFIYFSRLRALSRDGRCKTFDAAADVYARGGGCGMMVLKRLSDAVHAGDDVLAVIRGSHVNHDGRSNGLTVPSGLAQEAVARAALHAAGLRADDVAYVEAHGTGTSLGDPIEVHALANVYRDRAEPLRLGSVKTNIGHLEAAAGVAGLMKIVLMLRHRMVPPHLNLSRPNPYISWAECPVRVVTAAEPLPGTNPCAGVSAFGFGGTNAHIIAQAAPAAAPPAAPAPDVSDRPLHLLRLSAKTETALIEMARRMVAHLAKPGLSLPDLCWSANTGRASFEHRLVASAADTASAAEALTDWLDGRCPSAVGQARVRGKAPKVAFLFTGQGAQHAGMGRALFDTHPIFRDAIFEIEGLLAGKLDAKLTDLLWGPASAVLDQTQNTQPAMFAIQVALARLWESWGVVPAIMLGHSIGEVAAAHLAGVLSLADAASLVAARGCLMRDRCSPGIMVVVDCDEATARAALAGLEDRAALAALNGPSSVVVAGEAAAVEAATSRLAVGRMRRLEVSHGFHSPLMDPMLPAFGERLAALTFRPAVKDVITNLTGCLAGAADLATPKHWLRHVREPVRFASSIAAAVEAGADAFVEIGPRPVLIGMAKPYADAPARLWLPSLQPPNDAWQRLLGTVRELELAGQPVDWRGFDAPFVRNRVRLPDYPFEGERHWAIFFGGQASKPTVTETAPPAQPETALRPGSAQADRLYRIAWEADERPVVRRPAANDRTWLILADRSGVGAQLRTLLAADGERCVVARVGTAPVLDGDDLVMRPDDANDYAAVLDRIGHAGPLRIIHLWSLDAPPPDAATHEFTGTHRLSYQSGLLLIQALAARRGSLRARLDFVTRGAQAVVPGEPVPSFATAGLWGLARVVPFEVSDVTCVLADLDSAEAAPGSEAAWLAEQLGSDPEAPEAMLARRAGSSWRARLQRCPEIAALEAPALGGTWLISGGLGGIGLAVAEWLAERGAALVLVGRSAPTQEAADRVAALVEAGVKVQVLAADVCIAADAARVVAVAGALQGVVHAAGAMDNAMLGELTWDRCQTVVAPKLDGAWNLHRATADAPPAHFICFSSVSAVLGSPGHGNYAPANAMLDALAAHRHGQGLSARTINWGAWAGAGMAARLTGALRARWDALGVWGSLEPVDALDAFGRLLAATTPQVAVIATDWNRFFDMFPVGLEPPFLAVLGREIARIRPPSAAWTTMVQQARNAPATQRSAAVADWVETEVASVLGVSAGPVDHERGFFDLGMDSLMTVELRNRLQRAAGDQLRLPVTLAFDRPTIAAIAAYIASELVEVATEPGRIVAAAPPPAPDLADAVAIVGMGCRFPGGADDPQQFWQNLRAGLDAISIVPGSRWDVDAFYDPDPDALGKMCTRWGGFVDGIDTFDAAFFGISPREALRLDPQQRMLLETAWHTLEDAGVPVGDLTDVTAGVFIGVSVNDYAQVLGRDGGLDGIDAYMGVGNALSMVAGRLAHFLGLQGPAMSVDTACSSSLTAIHLACESLRKGECDIALAGGVNAILSPEINISLSKARMLAPDGRCKTFDADADGYGRGEGCGIVALKRLADAQNDGDRIHAVIRATGVNHDGRSSGLTVPNAQAQERLLRLVHARAGLGPADIDYVEAHGTGTPLGDPIEVEALGRVVAGRPAEHPLLVGTVKTNIGHLEAAAGSAGLIKTVLAIKAAELPATLHFTKPNGYIPWDRIRVQVVDALRPWPAVERPRRAGVSSFGFSGTNAHVIVEQAPPPVTPAAASTDRPSYILTLSARTAAAARLQATNMAACVDACAPAGLAALCHTANARRTAMAWRVAGVGSDPSELAAALRNAAEEPRGGRPDRTRTAFLFSGQGSQHPGMGRELFDTEPRFREAILACERVLAGQLPHALTELLWGGASGRLSETEFTQPCLFSLQYALGQLWMSWGVVPHLALGHSVGEYAASCLAGVFSLEDALLLVSARGRLMRERCAAGAMAALECDSDQIRALLAQAGRNVDIAVLNGPHNGVVGGLAEDVAAVIELAREGGVKSTRLDVSHAFHSAMMDPMLDAFAEVAHRVTYREPAWRIVSCVTGQLAEPATLASADYWVRHVRQPVLFEQAVTTASSAGTTTWIEIGPRPVLLGMARSVADRPGCRWLASLRPPIPAWTQILGSLADYWTGSGSVDWRGFDAPWARARASLPAYPFERQRFWPEPRPAAQPGKPVVDQPPAAAFPGRLLRSPAYRGVVHEMTFDVTAPTYIDDHRIFGLMVVPGASHLAMVCEALRQAGRAGETIVLRDVAFEEALVVPDNERRTVQLVMTRDTEGEASFEVHSSAEAAEGWFLHAAGKASTVPAGLTPPPPAPPVEDMLARCRDELPTGHVFYQLMAKQGIQLGSQFQWVDRLWRGDGEALGELREARPGDEADSYFVHPGLLDSCFQLMGAALPTKDLEAGALIPISMERLTFHARPSGRLRNHVRLRPRDPANADLRVADLVIFDAQCVVAEVRGLRIHRAPQESLTRLAHRHLRDAIYGLIWVERPRVELGAVTAGTRWVILGSGDALEEELAGLLRAAGAEAISVRAGPTFVRIAPDEFMINPRVPEDHARLWREIAGSNHAPEAVIDLWTAQSAAGIVGADAVSAAFDTGCLAAMHVVQTLAKSRSARPSRLVLVTRSAQPVDETGPIDVTHAALLGMGRVIDSEHPELRCLRIDIDADPDAAAEHAGLILDEALSESDEREVGLRRGRRYVHRLNRHVTERRAASLLADPAAAYRLIRSERGLLEEIALCQAARPAPGAGRVEIMVEATGLNFRDVLNALDLYPGDAGPMGGECAGIVSAVGPDVHTSKIGDRVVAIGAGTFARYTVTDARMAQVLPPSGRLGNLDAAGAATLPVAYVTAWLGLVEMAGLQAGETVLIHAGAGGVGMAAIQLARALGAEIHATCGSQAKQDALRALGVRHIYNSRSLGFADQVRAATGGRGVDVVLNSLASDFIPATIAVTALGGRFVEIGKTQIWSPEQVAETRPDLGYWVMALDALIVNEPAEVGRMLGEVTRRLADGTLGVLPHQSYPIVRAVDAFRFMAQARHIGKVVVTHRAAVATNAEDRITPAGGYVITGGLGGLGLALAAMLVGSGVPEVTLIGRSAASAPAEAAIERLRAAGADVRVCRADVSRRDELAAVLDQVRREGRPITGIVHAAGALDDVPIAQMTPERFRHAADVKVLGALLLDELTRSDPVERFILFSSVAAILGTPGQANYAAGNSALDAIAHRRARQGFPALSINWGPWDEAGMAVQSPAATRRLWAAMGITLLPMESGMATLDMLSRDRATQAVVLQVDWAKLADWSPAGAASPLLTELLAGRAGPTGAPAIWLAFTEELRAATPPERKSRLVARFRDSAARVLGLRSSDILETHTPLSELGLDSLMAVELANQLSTTTGAKLRVTTLFDYPTIDALATYYLRDILDLDGGPAPVGGDWAEPVRLTAENVLESVLDMSDDEVTRQLSEMRTVS